MQKTVVELEKEICPTASQYASFQKIYEYFNSALFDDALPDCILTFSRDWKSATAVFRGRRWFRTTGGKILYHEISLNPMNLPVTKPVVSCQSVVHEMCHAWQLECGTPGRNRYHNKEWAGKMIEAGLRPFNVRKPSISTGDNVSDKVIPGGRFEKAFQAMLPEYLLPFSCVEALRQKAGTQNTPANPDDGDGIKDLPQQVITMLEKDDPVFRPPKQTRFKYSCSCPGREQKNVWGKPGLSGILCEDCGEPFQAEDGE